jgi:hypothetical protein
MCQERKLAGLSLSGYSFLAPISRVTWSIENDKFMSSRKLLRHSIENDPSATVSYFEPEIVVSEAVPEPTTIAATILGLTSSVEIKQRKKIATN